MFRVSKVLRWLETPPDRFSLTINSKESAGLYKNLCSVLNIMSTKMSFDYRGIPWLIHRVVSRTWCSSLRPSELNHNTEKRSRFFWILPNCNQRQTTLLPRPLRISPRPLHPTHPPSASPSKPPGHIQLNQRPGGYRRLRPERHNSHQHHPPKPHLERRLQRRNPLFPHHLRFLQKHRP